jgi:hypothetical protein
MKLTDTALSANVITDIEANLLEDWIDKVVTENKVMTLTPPDELKELFDKVCLFRCNDLRMN